MKNDFEKMKAEYKKAIENNQEIVGEMAKAWDSKKIGIDFFSVIDPKNERELKYAISLMYITIDFGRFIKGLTDDSFEDFKYEDHEALQSVIEAVSALKETGDKDAINPNSMSMVERAKLLYGLLLVQCLGQLNEPLLEYTATKAGFDINDTMDIITFVAYVNAVLEVHQEAKDQLGERTFSEIEDEELDGLFDYAMKFHCLLEKDINKGNTK